MDDAPQGTMKRCALGNAAPARPLGHPLWRGEYFVEVDPRIGVNDRSHQSVRIDGDVFWTDPTFESLLAAGGIDQDAAHRLGGRGEKMPAIREGTVPGRTNQS